ncbi:MarR family winged helix-turn-helix transcriptional regulator [Gynuella sunshinyii]|uniref:MarR family winged helix-turn-helix transcriptional regulator n=1 Tax=Gynuella sunshinyii TaxID=1445505 RepID=UPI00069C9509|nr:MarR family transcriptional regulator [Gynuella sunshinyii]
MQHKRCKRENGEKCKIVKECTARCSEQATLVRILEAVSRRRNYPLERAHYLLLLQLRNEPLSIGELAERLMLDNSTVTRQVKAMEKQRLLIKIPNPADRRSTLVRRTELGASLAEDMNRLRIERLSHNLQDWPTADLQSLSQLTGRLNRALADHVRAGDEDD